ncbi:MAG: YceI family protein [Nitrospirae bacterium]|nr:YceI family protein [Nitrospirota bacterium]
MQRVDQSTAACQIFTFKEGMLSRFAHDLRINVTSFFIDVGGADHFISARFDTQSLRVDCAMADGRERPDLLSLRDKDDINNNIIREVLQAETYPEIALTSSSIKKHDGDYLVTGQLIVHGQAREISLNVRKESRSRYVVDVSLHLPDFGITPFSALFGAIRIKPDILVHIEIPAEHVPEKALA